MEVRDLGLVDYEAALRAQDEAVSAVIEEGAAAEVLLVCEHPAVITVGRALGSEKEVFSRDLPVFEVPRGGRATLHLPGQAVIYPILNLAGRGRDLHAYMRALEGAIIDTLGDFRIEAQSVEGKTGVWVSKSRHGGGQKKVASIGIAVKNWVSYHGLALNVNCDLSQFSKINPCGFSADVMTSVIEEMSDEYKKTWDVPHRPLLMNVTKRLVENLQERLEEPFT